MVLFIVLMFIKDETKSKFKDKINIVDKISQYFYLMNNTKCGTFSKLIKYQFDKLILECRYGCGMSIRNINKVINGYYSV